MAITNTNLAPLLKEGSNVTLTQNGQVITISANDTTNAPGGTDTQVQFNDGGNFGGDSGLTYNKTTNVLGSDSIDFAQTPTAADAERRLHWDNDEGSLVLTLKGGNVTIPLGQEVTSLVHNAEATTLTKGTVVYAFGASGQRVSVKKAVNTSDSTSAQTFGVVAESIASGAEGFVMVQGMVRGIDTSAYVQGDAIYLSATAGQFTKTKPVAPNHLVYVGFVVKINASSGEIFVKCQNGYEMDEIHDYLEGSVQDKDVISYESSTSLYKPKSIATLLGYTPVNPSTTLTINGTTYDLSANRTWSVGTVTSVSALTLGTTGTDLSSTVANGTTTPVITLNVPTASATNRGVLSSSDWSTFNSKEPALTKGNLTESTSSVLTISGGTGAVIGSGTSIQVSQASGSTSGYLSSTDWTTFNNKQNALTNPVTGTGTTNEIAYFSGTSAISSLSTGTYPSLTELSYVKGVTSAIQTQINGKQAQLNGTGFVKASGTTISYDNSTYYLASNPNGYTTNTGTVTSVGGTGTVNGITLTGTVTTSGNLTLGGTLSGVDLTSQVTGTLPVGNGGTGATAFTQGSVVFAGASGVYTQDNANFFWDDTNNRLGIGTTSPAAKLDIQENGEYLRTKAISAGAAQYQTWINSAGTRRGYFGYGSGSSLDLELANESNGALLFYTNSSERARITSGGNLLVGITTDSGEKLQVSGTGYIFNLKGGGTSRIAGAVNNTSGNLEWGLEGSVGNQLFTGMAAYQAGIGTSNSTSLNFATNTVVRATIDTSGNLGLGVTPSAWGSGQTAMQIGSRTAIVNASGGQTLLGNNYYSNGTNNIYLQTAAATLYEQSTGQHIWYTAPSGTAGNTISFTQAMTLTSGGNLLVGTTTDSGEKLVVNGTSKFTGAATFSSSVTGTQGVNVGSNALGTDRMFQVSGTAFTSGATQFGIVNNPTMSTPTTLYGYYGSVSVTSATTSYAIYIDAATGTITNKWGIYQNGSADRNYFAGNLLVGTTTDSGYKLVVNGDIASNVATGFTAKLLLKSGNGISYIDETDGNLNMRFVNTSTFNFGDNVSDIRFCTNNNTTTPALKLAISGAATFSSSVTATSGVFESSAITLKLGSATGNAGANLLIAGASTTKNWSLGVQQNIGGALEFTPTTSNGGTTLGTTPAMILTDGGNLLVGTTTNSGEKLVVNGEARIENTLYWNGTVGALSYAIGMVSVESTTTDSLKLRTNSADRVVINGSTGQLKFNPYTSSSSFSGTPAGYLAFDSSGNVLSVAVPGALTDGDKGDITVSSSGTVWTIDNTAVTYAKIQNVAANSFLANVTGSPASVQAIATNRIPLFASSITGTPSSSTFLRGDGAWSSDIVTISQPETITGAKIFSAVISADLGLDTLDGYGITWRVASYGAANARINFTNGLGMAFYSDGTVTPTMYLTDDGNRRTGFGTTTPDTKVDIVGDLKVRTISAATVDTDKFLVSDGGVIKYRTGSEILSDIGVAYTLSTKTTTYSETATSGEVILLADTSGGAFTINLPTAVSNTAKITIKKIAGSATLTIDANGSETIDGGLTASIVKIYESVTLVSNNSNWFII